MDIQSDTARKVAGAVSAALETAGVKTHVAAERTGIPRTTLSRRLTGSSPFTITELDLIASLLGVTVKHFLSDVEEAA